jgi:hypothetical protein
VLRDEVAFTNEVVLLDGNRPKIDVDGTQDVLQAIAALGTGGVVHHVRRDEIIRLYRHPPAAVETFPRRLPSRCARS